MKDRGYSGSRIRIYAHEADRLIEKGGPPVITNCEEYISSYQSLFGIKCTEPRACVIRRTYLYFTTEEFPIQDNRRIFASSNIGRLNDEDRALVDGFGESLSGCKEQSITTLERMVAGFLVHLKESGTSIYEATRDIVWAYFYDPVSQTLKRGHSVSDAVRRFLSFAEGRTGDEGVGRTLSFVPRVVNRKKPYPYLREEEERALWDLLGRDDCPLSVMDRAIIVILLLTGLRSCDIRGMQLDWIDLDKGQLHVMQQKTGTPLDLDLCPDLEDAILRYIAEGRPESDDRHLFLVAGKVVRPLGRGYINLVVGRAFDAASIRMNGERRGPHLFRHRAASLLIGSGVPVPVAYRLLGQTAPVSIMTYLGADERSLKACSLDMSEYIKLRRDA